MSELNQRISDCKLITCGSVIAAEGALDLWTHLTIHLWRLSPAFTEILTVFTKSDRYEGNAIGSNFGFPNGVLDRTKNNL
jgi:hypothetical protein